MKKIITVLMMALALNSVGQKAIAVEESPQLMSKGMQTAFVVSIPQATLNKTEKDWLKYLCKNSKGKATLAGAENRQASAVNKNISPVPFNVYSKVLETTEEVRITAWYTENDTVFISKELNNSQYLAVQKYMRDFALDQYRQAVQAELNKEYDNLETLEKQLAGLIKDEEKSVKNISSNQRNIKRADDAIVTTNANIQTNAVKVADQNVMIDQTAADPNATKGAKKTLSNLKSKQKKMPKENEKQGQKIDEWNKQIRNEERTIADLKLKQAAKTEEISKQKERVKETQNKLKSIV